MTDDALDRACEAAWKVRKRRRPWASLPGYERAAWRADIAAAMKVMADEIQAEHYRVAPDAELVVHESCNCGDPWPCATVRILDSYVGEQP